MDIADKERAFTLLRDRGFTKVVVEFSGGNDEGGADAVTATTKDGLLVPLVSSAYHMRYTRHQDGGWEDVDEGWIIYENSDRRPATDQEIEMGSLLELLEQPVYDEYHTFAGDFEVQGTVTWDVATGTVTMQRSEQVWTDMEDLQL